MSQTFVPDRTELDPSLNPQLEEEIEVTEMAALAARFVNSTKAHIFLTGKAGTGKTTFLRQLAETTHKSYLILAPTGIAALNAKGVTLHSQFLLPFGSFIPHRYLPEGVPFGGFHDQNSLASKRPLDARRRKVLRRCDLLIIDEVSMLRADLLDAVDYRMRSVKGRFDQSFGGAQVLLIGDLFQLPPIVKNNEWEVLSQFYRSMHFFDAQCLLNSGFEKLELDKVFRQKDGGFLRILNNLRRNELRKEDIDTLNKYYRPDEKIEDGVITLTTHNRQAETINNEKLQKLPGKQYKYSAEIKDDFPESMFPVQTDLLLKEGAQVMFIKNDSTEKRFYNGMIAQVVVLDKDEIRVKPSGSEEVIKVARYTWENKKYDLSEDTKEIEEMVVGQFLQFPLKLAWAITVHKSQGLTFDKAVIDVGRAFAPGQVYVALSRLRSLDGLQLRTPINASAVLNDSKVVKFSSEQSDTSALRNSLAKHQKAFIEEMLAEAFDFSTLTTQLNFIQGKFNNKMEFVDGIMQGALPGIMESLAKERPNTLVFRKQLQRLLSEEERGSLRERLQKGMDYYVKVLSEPLKQLFQHQEEVAQLSKAKLYAAKLDELEVLFVKQLGAIQRAAYLLECILNDQPITKSNEISLSHISMVQELREEAVSYVKANRQFDKGKSGRKRKGKLVSTGKRSKGSTYEETFRLHRSGKSVQEIADERGLKPSTIEGHLTRGVQTGELKVESIMNETAIAEIRSALENRSDDALSRIHSALKGKYSFDQLRAVKASVTSGKEP